MYRGFTGTVFVIAGLALAGQARASTISNYSISTGAQGGTPCSMSGSGPVSASCSSIGDFPAHSSSSVTLTDDSIQINVSGFHDAGAEAFASITHDDFYSVPVNGPVSAVVSLTCDNTSFPFPLTGHFSLGSMNVSPPVELFFAGASQGSGPCGVQYRIGPPPPGFSFGGPFTVSLSAIDNIVHLHTYIDASGLEADTSGSIFVQLTIDGFQDANGNPITATLVPEPGTWLTLGLGLLIVAGMRHVRTYTLIWSHKTKKFM